MAARREYPKYTVSQLTAEIATRLKGIGSAVLEGEISGWRRYPSGHAYFTLKDSGAQISCVMFASDLTRCVSTLGEDALKDGAKVELFGAVGVYSVRGNYQFVARSARLAGVGDLMRQFLELKAKLSAEGLFDAARKRPLPFMPRRIGIVTSEAGAVIHDMCDVLTRRFPNLEIRLCPCLVQGADAPATIVAGLRYFNSLAEAGESSAWRPDLLIVARGGGSFEDLFCFNDETLVRTVASSAVPVISAVGHETDFTLCDFAADRRAGTPSIAAEIAVPVAAELKTRLGKAQASLASALRAKGEWFAQRTDQLGDALATALGAAAANAANQLAQAQSRLEPAMRLAAANAANQLEKTMSRLEPAMRMAVADCEHRLEKSAAAIGHLSPYGVLERGYALVTDAAGAVVREAAAVRPGDVLAIRLARGSVSAEAK